MTNTPETKTKTRLPVLFRRERTKDGEVTACFPTLPGSPTDHATCYAHIGQHSGYSLEWYHKTRRATPEEYGDLLAELKKIYESDGDCELVVRNRETRGMRAERKAAIREMDSAPGPV